MHLSAARISRTMRTYMLRFDLVGLNWIELDAAWLDRVRHCCIGLVRSLDWLVRY